MVTSSKKTVKTNVIHNVSNKEQKVKVVKPKQKVAVPIPVKSTVNKTVTKGVESPTIKDLNSLKKYEVIEVANAPFKVRRVHGGFMYEYESGAVVFVSTNELVTD